MIFVWQKVHEICGVHWKITVGLTQNPCFSKFRSLHELYKAKAWGSALDPDLVIGFLMIIFSFGYLDVKRSREHFEVALGLCLLCSYFDRTTNLWNMYVSKFGFYYEFEGTKNIYVLRSWIWALEDHEQTMFVRVKLSDSLKLYKS